MSWGVITVELMGDLSSEVSAMVKSDKLAMLIDGDWVTGDPETISVSGAATDSIEGDRGILGSTSMSDSPRGVATIVALGSSWPVLVCSRLLAVSTGGGGRPSQPRSRS